MSWGYKGGIKLPGYDPLLVANAPTIGTATAGSSSCASVTFTAPSCTGGSVISTYTVFSNCGAFTNTGATSPIVVSGLTAGTAYTFKVIATNIYGPSYPSAASNSITAVTASSQSYTSAGTYSWVAPAGVTSVSVVAVGGGGGGGSAANPAGGGGELRYKNNISVTPGNSYTVVVGAGGTKGAFGAYNFGTSGGQSYFNTTGTVRAFGGVAPSSGAVGGAGGSGGTGDGGGNGGQGGPNCSGFGRGGGGAGGYAGTGGNGYSGSTNAGSAGAGGGGGGGGTLNCGITSNAGAGGGGVGLLGQGTSGGASNANSSTCSYGRAGSCGSNGANAAYPNSTGPTGGAYGGGGGRGGTACSGCVKGAGGTGGSGAVRIIWPGNTRSFPSTNAGNP